MNVHRIPVSKTTPARKFFYWWHQLQDELQKREQAKKNARQRIDRTRK